MVSEPEKVAEDDGVECPVMRLLEAIHGEDEDCDDIGSESRTAMLNGADEDGVWAASITVSETGSTWVRASYLGEDVLMQVFIPWDVLVSLVRQLEAGGVPDPASPKASRDA